MLDVIARADFAILSWIVTTFRASWLDPVMLGISGAGHYGLAFVVVCLAVAVTARERGLHVMALWRLVLAVTLASTLATNVLKPVFERERPWRAHETIQVVGHRPTDGSLPSGHSAAAVAGAIALSLMWRRGRALAWAFALLVLFSRLYLGVHYPTDVLAGALVGWGAAFVATVGVHPVGRSVPPVPRRAVTA